MTRRVPQDLDDYPTVTCPKCGREQVDMDGFGFLACIPFNIPVSIAEKHGVIPCCGYCTHPSITDGVCGICGEHQP